MDREFDGIEWDERKSAETTARRGFGFEVAADVFADDYIEAESSGRDFGEQRYLAIGRVDNLIVTVIWTPRGRNRRIISARLSSKKERAIYHGHREEKTF
ncbi:MAG TPA: BrnT family toxin [Candidatus Aquilonibacter sp.]|nr:BrnT family toxin [Candidatus Aquilonibacter sp.]